MGQTGATRFVEHEGGVVLVDGGQAVIAEPGEWVRYSSPATVHRDE